MVTTHQGEVRVGNLTWQHPYICRMLNKYIRLACGRDFAWTSFTLNDGFASRRHRDANNAGTSFILGFGNYTGGQVLAWPGDDRAKTLSELKTSDAVKIDPQGRRLL